MRDTAVGDSGDAPSPAPSPLESRIPRREDVIDLRKTRPRVLQKLSVAVVLRRSIAKNPKALGRNDESHSATGVRIRELRPMLSRNSCTVAAVIVLSSHRSRCWFRAGG